MEFLIGVFLFLLLIALFGPKRDPLGHMNSKERFEFVDGLTDEEYKRLYPWG